ncbi:uncharacterized protein SPPG_09335 [Spizellomyces punctatus DAOM BR117]|uniref:C2 domain-containing protein n=1 Tax=Spizellomyces punctatus (strain DAOM BR117) TaxID=645134 RepID=A0A0L0HCW6_SPIPD|nr:uncharacterized protein SPPG_09335 [Spizellomyces punctatus DAOM BR117]KNC98997.1 hypothetical protein SPPG_09335 [Spizellomyces punctatus DAOM BR117]|eukprot:XP_016607037.1 hypothetical protein SPPG_09335 [Spizellomyces punctatus DAOM BR117]
MLEEIRETRLLRDAEAQTDRLLEFKILQGWSQLKQIRETEGFASTSLKVIVRSSETIEDEDTKALRVEIANELSELSDMHELEKLDTTSVTEEESGLERQDTKDQLGAEQDTDNASTHGSQGKLRKDRKKRSDPALQTGQTKMGGFNAKRLKSQISKRLESSHRQPGFPILSFACNHTSVITPIAECPKFEQNRRQTTPPTFCLRLLYNRKEMTRTTAHTLDMSTFSVQFNNIDQRGSNIVASSKALGTLGRKTAIRVGARVKEVPECLEAEVYEKTAFGETLLCRIPIPIPSATETTNAIDRTPHALHFTGKSSYDATVGRGDERWLSGVVTLGCAWGVDDGGKSLGPLIQSNDLDARRNVREPNHLAAMMGPNGAINMRKLMDWVQSLPVDPNDPRSQDTLRLKRLAEASSSSEGTSAMEYWSSKKFCRLEIPAWIRAMALDVAVDNELNEKRFTLIKDRETKRGHITAEHLSPIPLLDEEIDEGMMQEMLDSDKTPQLYPMLSRHSSTLSLLNSAPTAQSDLSTPETTFLQRLRSHQLLRSTIHPQPKRHSDYVREEKLADRPQKGFFLTEWFRPRRPLRPYREDRREALTNGLQPEGCRLMVQILRGSNIPVRKDRKSIHDVVETESDGPVWVRPYVQLTFQNRHARTTTGEGPNPQWNETLMLPVTPPRGDQAGVEGELDAEEVRFDLFDEMLVDLMQEERDRDTQIHRRKDRTWLGSLTIPFSAIHEQIRLAGDFPVKLPCASIGYEHAPLAMPIAAVPVGIEPNKGTSLYMFITLDPPLAQPTEVKTKVQSLESLHLLRYCSSFPSTLPAHVQSRHIRITTTTLSQQTALISRFLRPQAPPPGLPTTPVHLLRYVTLLPYLPSRMIYPHSCWATTEQMMTLGAGGAAEHAILLCNYFKWCLKDVDSWVVLGRDVAKGRVAWVLTREEHERAILKEWKLWDPVDGTVWTVKDALCPLIEIGQLFDQDNVWVNIQQQADPARMSFNLRDNRSWRPLFHRAFPKPEGPSLQLEEPIYKTPDLAKLHEIEGRLERAIIAGIETWRGNKPTRWNRLASRTLFSALPTLETAVCTQTSNEQVSSSLSSLQDLSRLRAVYRLKGSPISLPYTDTNDILAAVQATDVHACADEWCEFACAVWCCGYAGEVVGVWIWIACLLRGR